MKDWIVKIFGVASVISGLDIGFISNPEMNSTMMVLGLLGIGGGILCVKGGYKFIADLLEYFHLC